ncbi:MAG: 23S rRNA (adenine(2503)-C(2))-methyltransferase RlmN [Bacteroidetes bacterium]|nr:23S rRNA (adenine(2503)-C(2))-methyltransferase RlmN [Bacteroidota bacterium]MBP6402299.1 23S rRNA (adenine(2503)-C(2))-methyltransferase RlmN [Bacteroidia bacterium]MBK6836903.1 23S rRNA (adenine(2503)-C(2))-methyltransferase RlmN [Bacteroidota bacterium]MBK9523693.1 23S rRNA (adenine(2503)-C(2))-methyltransferase RlmN [Bacteroidota bacterium]MBK9541438.1 23S rRNA (adenine(2503)-C(2))-methyltransferase RlmN [Bacteroidota bacterium]
MQAHPEKTNIRDLSKKDLETWFIEHGEQKFRATQVWEWLWQKSARSFEGMSNLSKALREKLPLHFSLPAVSIDTFQVSSDRTIKNAFRLFDGNIVEGVLIPTDSRMTACVSSQVGCSLTCKFCATGKLERLRNLNADEIYDQVAIIREQALANYNIPLSNIVYMGMGEPLLNYANVMKSIEHITSPEGLGMSPQRITVSTAGISKMIKKLGDDEAKFNLALSLHAANETKRNQIMPINESNSLDSLAESLNYFYDKTGTRVTFEYIVFNGFNDALTDAKELEAFCRRVTAKVNLIEYNPIDGGEFINAKDDKIEAFKNYLEDRGVIVNIRRSRGKDIDAACGQLANKNEHAVARLKKQE